MEARQDNHSSIYSWGSLDYLPIQKIKNSLEQEITHPFPLKLTQA